MQVHRSIQRPARRARCAWLCLATWGSFVLLAPLVHARFHELLGLHPEVTDGAALQAPGQALGSCPIGQVQHAAGLLPLSPPADSLAAAEPARPRLLQQPAPGARGDASARAPPLLSTV